MGTIFLPPVCFACETKISRGYLCPRCEGIIAYTETHVCRLCAHPLGPSAHTLCRKCRSASPGYQHLICALRYQYPLTKLVQLFKYSHYDYLAPYLASFITAHLQRMHFNPETIDMVTAIPLHPQTHKARGYNQTALLAAHIANYFNLPCKNDIIYQRVPKKSQTKVSPNMRNANVAGIFKAQPEAAGKRILLVDDIFTTGSTLRETSKTLKEAGALAITAVTLARA